MKPLCWMLILFAAVPALAEVTKVVPRSDGTFVLDAVGFPYEIEIVVDDLLPDAVVIWSADYGFGAVRGLPHPTFPLAFDPQLEQYAITPPDGWEVVAVNEDATLAIIVPAPAASTWDDNFEHGYLKQNHSIRIFPIEANLDAALDANEPCMMLNKPKLGSLVCGSDTHGRIAVDSEYTLASNENVKYFSNTVGLDRFDAVVKDGSAKPNLPVDIEVTANPYDGTFIDNETGKRWVYDTTGRSWLWGHNLGSRQTRLWVRIYRGDHRIIRSIMIPNSVSRFNGNLQTCDLYAVDGHNVRFDGESPYRTDVTPSVSGIVATAADGAFQTEVPFAWVGQFYVEAVAVCPPIVHGDMNCDGAINLLDIDPFNLAKDQREDYRDQYPNCNWRHGDMDDDLDIDDEDTALFTALLQSRKFPVKIVKGDVVERVRAEPIEKVPLVRPGGRSNEEGSIRKDPSNP
jgi:hypothetical protein